jgi:hypothetical protein
MPAPRKTSTSTKALGPDEKIVQLFFKSVGAQLGYYNAQTKSFSDDMKMQPQYHTTLKVVQEVLTSGQLSSKELEDLILDRYRAGERTVSLASLLPKQKKALDGSENLLEDGFTYAHTYLYERTNPSFAIVGEGMVATVPGRVALKKTFTLDDLLTYYYAKTGCAKVPGRKNRDLGAFRYLLEAYPLDRVLHAIDLAGDIGVRSVLKLEDHMDAAEKEVKYLAARRHAL